MKLIILVIIVITVSILIRDAWSILTQIKKSKALVEAAIPFERLGGHETRRIVVLGDSTAVGVGARDPVLSTAGRLAMEYPKASIVNLSKSGWRASDLRPAFEKMPHAHADLIVIQIGGNDIVRFTPLDNLERDIVAIIKTAKEQSDHVVLMHSGDVGLAPIFPPYVAYFLSKRTRDVRDIYIKLAEEHHFAYVDLYRTKENDLFLTDIDKFYANDHFHPSGFGYEDWFTQTKASIITTYGGDSFLR